MWYSVTLSDLPLRVQISHDPAARGMNHTTRVCPSVDLYLCRQPVGLRRLDGRDAGGSSPGGHDEGITVDRRDSGYRHRGQHARRMAT